MDRKYNRDYYIKPLDDLVGFNQIPQNQFIDNRTTSVGEPVIDRRSQSDKDYDAQISNQGLYDMTLDLAIPTGQLIARGIGAGAGLGLDGINYMKNLRGSGAGSPLANEGRRQSMQLAGAGLSAGAFASAPALNIAAKGLGLSDNVVMTGAKAPVSIAKLKNARDIGISAGKYRGDWGAASFLNKEGTKVSGINAIDNLASDTAKAIDDALVNYSKKGNVVTRTDKTGKKMSPETYTDGKKIILKHDENAPFDARGDIYFNPMNPKQKVFDEGLSYDDIIYASRNKEKVFDQNKNLIDLDDESFKDVVTLFNKQQNKASQGNRIQKNAEYKYHDAIMSKDPVFSPSDLNKLISDRKFKIDNARKELSKKPFPGTKRKHELELKKYEPQLESLNNQLNTLVKSGNYGKIEKGAGVREYDLPNTY